MPFKVGIDVGNYDTKTQHTKTPSGYTTYDIKPALASEYLLYNGKYYAPSVNRFEYVKDKTATDQALILTLFGIAKEIVYSATNQIEGKHTRDAIQSIINGIKEISIGVGLPVADFMHYKDKTVDYYYEKIGKGSFELEYNGFHMNLLMTSCSAFPQDIMPVAANKSCEIAQTYKKYLIIGIGGQTVDVIPIVEKNTPTGIKKEPVMDSCKSLREGTRRLFYDIIGKIEMNYGYTIGEDTVEEVLMGEATPLPDDIEVFIREAAKQHADKVINKCVQSGINFIEYPVVFFGGGGLLLRPFLENNTQIHKSEFLMDVNGNAVFFASRIPG